MGENKLIPRFIIALILAAIAGAGNYWYLTKAKFAEYLVYGTDVKKGDEISSSNLAIVRFSVPDDATEETLSKTFLSSSKLSALNGAKLYANCGRGELVLASHLVDNTNVEPADYRAFGNFRVVDVGDSTITVEIEAKNGTLDALTRRLIEISNYDPRSKDGARIYGVVEHSATASSENEPEPNGDFGENAREKLTVRLPPNCALPASLVSNSRGQNDEYQAKDVRVGFIVSASLLSARELRETSSVGAKR